MRDFWREKKSHALIQISSSTHLTFEKNSTIKNKGKKPAPGSTAKIWYFPETMSLVSTHQAKKLIRIKPLYRIQLISTWSSSVYIQDYY